MKVKSVSGMSKMLKKGLHKKIVLSIVMIGVAMFMFGCGNVVTML